MLCNQCEQRAIKFNDNKEIIAQGCTNQGVCGKNEEVAKLQDALVYALRLLSATSIKAQAKGFDQEEVNHFIMDSLFSTLTNVNFSASTILDLIRKAILLRKDLSRDLGCTPKYDDDAIQSALNTLLTRNNSINAFSENEDICSAMQILLYGLKGIAAYSTHARLLGKEDKAIYDFIKRALSVAMPDKKGHVEELSLDDWLGLLLECGQVNLRVMEILEEGHTENYQHPTPTSVNLGHKKGKAILVSGHDLHILHTLLEQTKDMGINIYTHGEMLPAHGYPKLKEFSHLVGHYGTAWQNQQKELKDFPGAILFTSNCIQAPKGYEEKVFTTACVQFDELSHCLESDFSALIAKAKDLDGFREDYVSKDILVGFGRDTLLNASSQVLEAISNKTINHIFLVGGCDGAKQGRNYFTEFVEKTPQDSLVLTLGCGKYRFFDKDLGTIGEFPRLMDIGQCNDAYAAIQIALALAKALDCSVNDLPLSLVISWYEQKAVSILLSLLALGVKNVYLGPSLPAFISPNILQILVDNWGIKGVSSVDEDIKNILG